MFPMFAVTTYPGATQNEAALAHRRHKQTKSYCSRPGAEKVCFPPEAMLGAHYEIRAHEVREGVTDVSATMIYQMLQLAVGVGALTAMALFVYDLLIRRAGCAILLGEGLVFVLLTLATMALGIRPPAPPPPPVVSTR